MITPAPVTIAPEGERGGSDEKESEKEPAKPSDEVEPTETACAIILQAFGPLFFAGFGQVGAGLILDKIQHWHVFDEIPELFTLVTSLVGLKGNLEMTLASRLSTLANLGKFDNSKERFNHLFCNVCLVEVLAQATFLSFLAAIVAMSLRWVTNGEFVWQNAWVLAASSLSTGCSAALILAIMMILVILASRSLGINPDNVATPLAASFGDLVTMTILAQMSTFFLQVHPKQLWICPTAVALFLLLTPVWLVNVYSNATTKSTLTEGLNAIVCAMLISSTSGYILGYSIRKFEGICLKTVGPVGLGGNLVAVQASRMSTYLHKHCKPKVLPDYATDGICWKPWHVLFDPHSVSARALLIFTAPGHLTCLLLIYLMGAGHTSTSLQFICAYLTAAFFQGILLLYACHLIVHWMWQVGTDPDNVSIPYLTALGDFLGTSLLALSFLILYSLGDHDKDVGD
ncbi:solute carrier family 41 [Trichuris trichiura]|uniref:Solute carrier family 41 n=1 Tax=Trichuris trichiura TaxID=36087 RepID=A0A077Z6U2_TRITR|nr:solute carrier family 41 [Trichuris trichiura]